MPSDRVDRLTEAVDETQGELAHLRDQRARTRSRLTQLETDIGVETNSFERQAEEIDRRIAAAGGMVNQDVRAQLQSQRARLADEHHGRLSDLEADLSRTRAVLTELDEREPVVTASLDFAREELARANGDKDTTKQLEEAKELRARLAALEADRVRLAEEIEESRPAVEAYRQVASSSGAEDLAAAYEAEADRHAEQWRFWLKWLLGAVAATLGLGVGTILVGRPGDDATTQELVSSLALDALVLGILLYLVRLTASQFRVHRHLEAVGRSKAAALNTFRRIVVGPSDADARAAVAVALAQAVFAPDATGFVDPSQDQVTFVERVVGPVLQRGSSAS